MRALALFALALAACTSQPGACESSDASNPAGCPASWAEATVLCRPSTPCSRALTCAYPGVGDEETTPAGATCYATGVLGCFAADDGGMWQCAQ